MNSPANTTAGFLRWEFKEEKATIWLPKTGQPITLGYRPSVEAHDLFDARRSFDRRLNLFNIIIAGLKAIRSGQSPEDAFDCADEYLQQGIRSQQAIWDSCHLTIALCLEQKEAIDFRRLIPDCSDELIALANGLYWRVGLSDVEKDNLHAGALQEMGLSIDDDAGLVRSCECSSLHDRGPCPNWESFAWEPKAKRVWNQWRKVAAGGRIDQVDLAFLDGRSILDAIQGELEAAEVARSTKEAIEKWSEKP